MYINDLEYQLLFIGKLIVGLRNKRRVREEITRKSTKQQSQRNKQKNKVEGERARRKNYAGKYVNAYNGIYS